jgi:hypothetical protein
MHGLLQLWMFRHRLSRFSIAAEHRSCGCV